MFRCIRIGIEIVLLILIFLFCKRDSYDFEQNREDMEKIAEEIVQGKYEISENGLVKLPEGYAHLSDTGEVSLVIYDDKPAVYFWTFRGIIDSSKGYIYILDTEEKDIIDKCSNGNNYVNEKNIYENWYGVSTDWVNRKW